MLLVNYSIRELKDSIQLQNMQVCACSDTSTYIGRITRQNLCCCQQFTPPMLHSTWVEAEYRLVIPVPLMETMLGFMEHEVKKFQFSLFVSSIAWVRKSRY